MKAREKIKTIANSMLGLPYVWGGESMEEGGYDCSGFVYALLNRCDIPVKRTTAQGYYNKFCKYPRTNKLQVQCGDLIFFGKDASHITHIAVAKDCNAMWESIGGSKNSKKNPGKGITLSSIDRRKDIVAIINFIGQDTVYYAKYIGNSYKIDEVFATIGAPYGSVAKRKSVATANDISNYKGTVNQNLSLISKAKAGKLVRA